MNGVLVIGAGPAASLVATALARDGDPVRLIGQLRRAPAIEGVSHRAAEAIERLGCRNAATLLNLPWRRTAIWGGKFAEMNGEFVVERRHFDAALLQDAQDAGASYAKGWVRATRRCQDGGWEVEWIDHLGVPQLARTELLVECRGRAAPKRSADLSAEPVMIALGAFMTGANVARRTTFVESFANGWAWGVAESAHAFIQIVVEPAVLKERGQQMDSVLCRCLEELPEVRRLLGSDLQVDGRARARAIRVALHGGVADHGYLRVGDAAYTCDPLSGSGIFEAASGAVAAVPVIRTLRKRPSDQGLALRYYRERAMTIFRARVRTAQQTYSAETQWRKERFWKVQEKLGLGRDVTGSVDRRARFEQMPVVEDGYIVEREIVLEPSRPRGTRFIDGVDLCALRGLLVRAPLTRLSEIAQRLGVPIAAARNACAWLYERRLIAAIGD